jgi:hypothetical protein
MGGIGKIGKIFSGVTKAISGVVGGLTQGGGIFGLLKSVLPLALNALAPGVGSAISAFASSPLGGFVSKLFPEASSTIQSLVGGGTSNTAAATGKNWWDSMFNAVKA